MEFVSKEHKAYAKHGRLWSGAPEDLGGIRVGILGCANIAAKNIAAIERVSGVQVVAIGSRTLEKAQAFAEKHNIPRAYGSYEQVLSDTEVDAIYIPLPTSLHEKWAKEAAKSGMHILVEKPCALSGESLLSVIKECQHHKVCLMDGTMFMHHERLKTISKDLDSHKFGINGVTHVSSSFCFPGSPDFFENDIRVKPDGDPLGCLGDLGWYNVRLALFAFGWELPCYASATVHKFAEPETKVPIDMNCTLTWTKPFTRSGDGLDPDLDAGGSQQVRSTSFHVSFCHAKQQYALLSGESGTLAMDDFVLAKESEAAYWQDETNIQFNFTPKDGTTITSDKKIYKTHPCRQECEMWATFRNAANATKSGANILFFPGIALATQICMDALMVSALSDTPGARVPVDPKGLMSRFCEL